MAVDLASLPFWKVEVVVPRKAPAPKPSLGVVRPANRVRTLPTAARLSNEDYERAVRDLGLSSKLSNEGTLQVIARYENVCKILRGWAPFAGKLAYNKMSLMPELDGQAIDEPLLGRVHEQIEGAFRFTLSGDMLAKAIRAVAGEKEFHEVEAYLCGLTWDGEKRLERVATDILGIDAPTKLQRAMIEKWFVAAVARGLEPGCKVDTALVLFGKTGFRKSTFFEVLGGKWYSNSHMTLGSKDAFMQLHAAWIYEWAEIDEYTGKRHQSEIKRFITTGEDNFRPPYDRATKQHKRSTVIVGTTNQREFLDDPTGSRRFWVIEVTQKTNFDLLRSWRDQLWAEAVERFRSSAGQDDRWWLSDEEEAEREQRADSFQIEDPWEIAISKWLGDAKPEVVCVGQVLWEACSVHLKDHSRNNQTQAGRALSRLRWVQGPRMMVGGIRLTPWFPPGTDRRVSHMAPGESLVKSNLSRLTRYLDEPAPGARSL